MDATKFSRSPFVEILNNVSRAYRTMIHLLPQLKVAKYDSNNQQSLPESEIDQRADLLLVLFHLSRIENKLQVQAVRPLPFLRQFLVHVLDQGVFNVLRLPEKYKNGKCNFLKFIFIGEFLLYT